MKKTKKNNLKKQNIFFCTPGTGLGAQVAASDHLEVPATVQGHWEKAKQTNCKKTRRDSTFILLLMSRNK